MASERMSRISASEGSATASLPPMPAMFMPPKLDIIQLVADARGSNRLPAMPPIPDMAIIGFIMPIPRLGAISGVPMPPEQIRALTDSINRQKLAHSLPSQQQDGAGPAE